MQNIRNQPVTSIKTFEWNMIPDFGLFSLKCFAERRLKEREKKNKIKEQVYLTVSFPVEPSPLTGFSHVEIRHAWVFSYSVLSIGFCGYRSKIYLLF